MSGEKKRQAVIFRSCEERFAFFIEDITEINSRASFTKIPKLPDYISGVINLMGDVIPVIDFRKRLGFPDGEYGERSCLIVIKSEENTAAVRVDEVITSMGFEDGEFMELPEDDSIISGYITDGEGRISVINTAKIFETEGLAG